MSLDFFLQTIDLYENVSLESIDVPKFGRIYALNPRMDRYLKEPKLRVHALHWNLEKKLQHKRTT